MKKILLFSICFILISCSFSITTFAGDPPGFNTTFGLDLLIPFQLSEQTVDPINEDMKNVIAFDISKGQYTSDFNDFISDLEALGYTVATIDITDDIPDNVMKLIISAAASYGYINDEYTVSEAEMLETWVHDDGGELFVLCEWGPDFTDYTKHITAEFGVTQNSDYVTDIDENLGSDFWPIFSGYNLYSSNPIFTDVTEVAFYSGCSFGESTGVIIRTDDDGSADPFDAPVAYAKDWYNGRVALYGDYDWITDFAYNDLDHSKLAINTILWLNGYFDIDVTKDFRYTSVTWDNIIYYEDFSTCGNGWIKDPDHIDNWLCSISDNAGGTPDEINFHWSPSFYGSTIEIQFTAGGWPYECSYDLFNSEGSLILGGYYPDSSGTWTGDASCTGGCRQCDYEICLYDDYGDGWNGGTLDILVDGVVVLDDITLETGAGPEYFTFTVDNGLTWLQSPPINTIGRSWVEVSFKQFVDHYSGDYELGVEASTDGTTWTEVYSQIYTANSVPETISFMLPNAFIDSLTTYIRFYFLGASWKIDDWYIDDVMFISDGYYIHNLENYLPYDGYYYLVDAVIHPNDNPKKKDVIKSTNPGQLYGVITVTGPVEELILWDVFDDEFDVHPGKIGGGVEVILVDPWGFVTILTDTSSIDFAWVKNNLNEVALHVSLDNPLPPLYKLMIFIKYQLASKHVVWVGEVGDTAYFFNDAYVYLDEDTVNFEEDYAVEEHSGQTEIAEAWIKLTPK
jgi:hypothetical protein